MIPEAFSILGRMSLPVTSLTQRGTVRAKALWVMETGAGCRVSPFPDPPGASTALKDSFSLVLASYLEGETPRAMTAARIPRRERWSSAGLSCQPLLSGDTEGRWLGHCVFSPFVRGSLFLNVILRCVSQPSHASNCTQPHCISPPFTQCVSRSKQSQPYKSEIFLKISEKLKHFTGPPNFPKS